MSCDLSEILITSEGEQSKKILSTTVGHGLLRKSLMDSMGIKRVNAFLFHYGWSLGVSDAEEAIRNNSGASFEDLLKEARPLHIRSGHITGAESERHYELDGDQNIIAFHASGKWYDSFEAAEHVKHYGRAKEPVCHTITGYASGYISTIGKRMVIAIETHCVARGDAECRYEMKLLEDWGDEAQEVLQFYNQKHIVDELEYTYEQLLEQRNYIAKVSTYHKKLTELLSNGSDLKMIGNTSYELLGIPVIIEDLNFERIVSAGMDDEQFNELDQEFRQDFPNLALDNGTIPVFTETESIKLINHERLITPITVQKKHIGYCTFIYMKGTEKSSENDFMFVERLANAASLYLLNQKASFDAIERMKGDYLEQILTGYITTKEEMITRGRYMGFDLDKPYCMAAIVYKLKEWAACSGSEHMANLMEMIAKFFSIQGDKVLIGQYEGQIIMLLPSQVSNMRNKVSMLLRQIEDSFPDYLYKIGISHMSENIEHIKELVEEALIAARTNIKNNVVEYKDLGVLGVLVNSKNENAIKKIADRELGPLLKCPKPKGSDLIKTLYTFLSNGCRLNQTMEDLSLSMSGLTYRISRIEKLLNKELRDPSASYQLLLILDSLIAIGELEL